MTKRMLINGRHTEEVRVAIVDERGVLQAYQVAVGESHVERGNIYRGMVANVEPSLDAAFVEYGSARHGFLTRHDVVEQAYHRKPRGGDGKGSDKKGSERGGGDRKGGEGRPGIDQVLQKGMPVQVQVTRDAAGTKGATLTTNLSLAGRYLVLMPYDTGKGVSRKVEDEDLRRKLKEKVKNLVSGEHGFIVRTNAADQTKTELKADLDRLKRVWKQVQAEATVGRGPRLLYNDQDLVVQVLRDQLDGDITEVVVDDPALHERAAGYVAAVMPRRKVPVTLYRGRVPLFSRYNLEPQISVIYRRQVPLSGGGSLVIDPTEALTAVDVNSGKARGGETQQQTALTTNLEAANEVARQLRLRDIGGLVVVDFIDMRASKHQRQVEKAVKTAMKDDRARSHAGRISGNGLMEINRQRVGQALHMRTHVVCPACDGIGRLVNPELLGLGLLRQIEARAATGRLSSVRVALHPAVAEALQNRRRAQLAELERTYRITIEVVARPGLARSDERLEWVNRPAGEEWLAPEPEVPAAINGTVPGAATAIEAVDEDNEEDEGNGDGDGGGEARSGEGDEQEGSRRKAKRRRRGGRRRGKKKEGQGPEAQGAADKKEKEGSRQPSKQEKQEKTEPETGAGGDNGGNSGNSGNSGSEASGESGATSRRASRRRRGGRSRRRKGNGESNDPSREAGQSGGRDGGDGGDGAEKQREKAKQKEENTGDRASGRGKSDKGKGADRPAGGEAGGQGQESGGEESPGKARRTRRSRPHRAARPESSEGSGSGEGSGGSASSASSGGSANSGGEPAATPKGGEG